MKKADILFAGVFFLLLSVCANAQTKTGADYFVGQWNLLAEGTPGGDSQMVVRLERKEGKLDGIIKIGEEKEIKFSGIEEKGTSVILNFTSNHGYNIKLYLEKKDDNHVGGTIIIADMGNGDITGERIIKK
jgi:uncharacterized protein YfiM (DUF2279 family)